MSTPEYQTYIDVSSYLKIYPNFTRLIKFDNPVKVQESGWETDTPHTSNYSNSDFIKYEYELKSLQRSKTKISDIVLCNKFDLFSTFTFNKDRQDIDKCKQKMANHLKNSVKRHGRFDYLIIPEYHSDNLSIHFHALTYKYPAELKYSGIIKNGQMVYNIKNYRLGYSTATRIRDQARVSNYIKKYITKDMPHFKGANRYWVSHGLKRPQKVINPNLSQEELSNFTALFHKKNLTVFHSNTVLSKYN